jgi:carbonic anhydrase/acetyltransferase-like protein (isoleucine patch superfamily)
MIIEHQGKSPKIHPSAYIAPNAVVSGDVTIGPDSRILFGAVVTSEGAPIQIGKGTIIMENSVVRASGGRRRKFPTIIGDYVLIGPNAYISGATLEYRAFVATGGVVLNGSIVERNAAVTIGSIVHIQTRVPAETVVPLQHIVIGNPCKLFASNQADAVIDELMRLNYRDYIFGLNDHQILAEVYSRSLGAHLKDRLLEMSSTVLVPEPAVASPTRSTKSKSKK